MTTDIDIAAIEAAAKAATPGPWYPPHFGDTTIECQCLAIVCEGLAGGIASIHVGNGRPIGDGGNDAPPPEEAAANGRYIALASPDTVLALIERLRAAEEALADARNTALEEAIEMLTCHELYRYRPKAFHGYIDYVRSLKKDAPHG